MIMAGSVRPYFLGVCGGCAVRFPTVLRKTHQKKHHKARFVRTATLFIFVRTANMIFTTVVCLRLSLVDLDFLG